MLNHTSAELQTLASLLDEGLNTRADEPAICR